MLRTNQKCCSDFNFSPYIQYRSVESEYVALTQGFLIWLLRSFTNINSIPGKNQVTSRMRAKLLQSCPSLCNPMDLQPSRLFCPWDSPGKNTGVGCHFLQGIFQTLGSNPGLLHWQADCLPLSQLGNPKCLCLCSVSNLSACWQSGIEGLLRSLPPLNLWLHVTHRFFSLF